MRADLCIVATRRPDLLSRTLSSFGQFIFPKLDIAKVIVNIDPVFGDASDQIVTEEIVKSHFPGAIISTPKSAGFAAAVARVWRETEAEYVLHIEEDWLALKDPGDFAAPFARHANLAQSLFYMASHKNTVGLRSKFRRRKLLGVPVPWTHRPVPHIGTSPGLYHGEFVRNSARLMDPSLDPEKQFSCGRNVALEQYAAQFDTYIHSPDGGHVIADLGRDWLAQRGIKKEIVCGAVSWSDPTA